MLFHHSKPTNKKTTNPLDTSETNKTDTPTPLPDFLKTKNNFRTRLKTSLVASLSKLPSHKPNPTDSKETNSSSKTPPSSATPSIKNTPLPLKEEDKNSFLPTNSKDSLKEDSLNSDNDLSQLHILFFL